MIRECYFAGGCFWCIASVYTSLKGVKSVISGYSGGDEINPTYQEVKAQLTGHRETIKIIYDDELVGFKDLLRIFIDSVDPFDEGGQFIDRGHSYTLAIYYQNEEEKEIAKEMANELEQLANQKPYIAIEEFKSFYDAEEYHQNYHIKNPEAFEKELIESGRKK